MSNMKYLYTTASTLVLFLVGGVVALAFNGPPPGSPPTGDGSIVSNASNDVGIGTTNPGSRLTVRDSSAGTVFAVRNTGDTANTFAVSDAGVITAGSLAWSLLTNFPAGCPANQAVQTISGTPVCIAVGTGTVTSVSGSGGTTGLTLTGGPITTSGTLTIGGTLAVANGGTGATTASGARANLGAAASGANFDITSLAGLTTDLSVSQGGTGLSSPGTAGNVLTSDGLGGWTTSAPTGDISGVTAGTGLTGGGTSGAVTVSLATPVTAANGGTGLVSPSTAGNVLTSNGVGGWTSSAPAGDISGVTAGTGLSGGGASGAVTVSLATPVTAANGGTGLTSSGVSGNVLKSNGIGGWISQAENGDISGVTAGTGLSGGGTTGAVTLNLAVPIAAINGGTAQTTYTTGDLLYASFANTLSRRAIGSAGQVLTVSGGVPVWAAPSAGTVTSVSGSGGSTGLTLSGGPITTSGTLTIGGTLAVANGGTGLTSPGLSGNVLKSNGVGGWISQAENGDISGVTAGTGLSGGGASGAVTLNLATPVTVANGGTGIVSSGFSGNVLTSNGVGGWTSSAPAGDISGVTAGTGLSGGGTSGAVTVSLATPVAATNGGTAQTTYTTGDILYASGVNALGKRAIGSAGQVLTVSGGLPVWATPTSGGETNTASNVGVGGVGVFKQKTGVNLEFKNVNAASGKVSVANDVANNEIDVDVVEAGLTLGNLGGTLPVAKGGTGSTDGSIAGTGALTFAAGGVNQNVTLTPSGSGSVAVNGSASVSGGVTAGGLVGASWTRLNNPPSTPATVNAKAFSGLPIMSLFDTTNTYAVAQFGETGDLTIRRSAAGNALTIQNAAGATNFNVTDAGAVTAGTWQGSAVGVAYGGTGASTLPANNVLLGNGTAAVQAVAPGTSGNVLTSNGAAWVSQAPQTPGGAPSSYELINTGGSGGVAQASCSVGKKVVGGGCNMPQGIGTDNCRLVRSYPIQGTPDSWYCVWYQRAGTGFCGSAGESAYAICM